MTDPDVAYIAGFFEGEGYVGHNGRIGICVVIGQSDPEVLDWIQETLLVKYGFICGRYFTPNKGKGLHTLAIRGGRSECVRFLSLIRPSMHHPRKIQQAEDAVSAVLARTEEIIAVAVASSLARAPQ